jgi:hypothetical protein
MPANGYADLALAERDDEFDLDLRITLPSFDLPPDIGASGTCGGCPDWTDEGSSCAVTCDDTACTRCTANPSDPDCAQ